MMGGPSAAAGAGGPAWRQASRQGLLGGATHILAERARAHHWEGAGSLSIKAFFSGQAQYRAGGGLHQVDAGSYLLLNEGQPYAVTIESPVPVESFCVFFGPGLAQRVLRDLTAAPELLLDAPGRPAETFHVFERTYPHDSLLSPALLHLRTMLLAAPVDDGPLGEALYDLLVCLVRVQAGVWGEVAALSAVRAATREEIYRRVALARDYALALFDQPVTLDDMARVACLSPNHLLRCFKEAFGQTPHQFLIDTRLRRARDLLRRTDLPVTEICLAVGFQSLGSFSWLFRRRTGVSPQDYRRLR